MQDCPLCGMRRDEFTLLQITTEPEIARKLQHNSSSGLVLGKNPIGKALRTEHTHVCRFGHFWPTGVDQVTIVRLLGTTAAGKTMLLRNLAGQDVGALEEARSGGKPVMFVAPPKICRRPFDHTVHPAATSAAGQNESFRQVLEDDWLKVKPGALDEFLSRTDLQPEEVALFGKGDNWPIHLLIKTGRVTRDNLFVDSSGEATAGNEERWETLKLHQSDGILWVIDAGLLPAVEDSLTVHDPRLLIESMRPETTLGVDWRHRSDAEFVEATRSLKRLSEERRQLTRRLVDRFAVKSMDLPDVSLRSVVLSKADLIYRMLARSPRWAEFRRPNQSDGAFKDAFAAGGTAFMQSYVSWRHRLMPNGPSSEVLNYLAAADSSQPDAESRRRCARVVRSVLDFYGNADNFYALVCHEGSTTQVIDVPGDGARPGVRLLVPPMRAAWVGYRDPTTSGIQHRDLVVGVLVRSLLDYCLDLRKLKSAENIAPVRYFLTAPMDGQRQVEAPYGDSTMNETPGVLHLLAWVLA